MSQSWTLSRFLILFCLAFTLAGCYEKMPRNGDGSGGGGGGKPGGGGGGDKKFGLAIVDIISPAADALSDPACGNVDSSLSGMRQIEMAERSKSVLAVVEALAEQIRIVNTEILKSDCNDFQALENRAAEPLADPHVDEGIKAKPALHLRLVLWYGDRSSRSVAPAVAQSEWWVHRSLTNYGFLRILNVNHFARTGANGFGYMSSWQRRSDPNFNFNAFTVNHLLPTDQGENDLKSAVNRSAAAFTEWLLEKASGI